MTKQNLINFTNRYMKYRRDTGNPAISYPHYLFVYELTQEEKEQYQPYLAEFQRTYNRALKWLKTDALTIKNMKMRIDRGDLPNQFRLFLKHY